MKSGSFHNSSNNNLLPDFFSSSRPSTRPSTAQSKYDPRLDNPACLRSVKSFSELRNCGNVGPGSYDAKIPRGSSAGGMTRTYYPPELTVQAPPIGTYNLPRILSPGVPGSEMGKSVTSSFRSRGKGLLMLDGEHYNTLREDLKFSNLGPGYYDLRDDWKPASFIKYDKKSHVIPGKQQRPMILNKSTNTISHDAKPWQQKKRASKRMSDAERARNPFDTSDIDAVGDHQRDRQKDIESVRNLPQYHL